LESPVRRTGWAREQKGDIKIREAHVTEPVAQVLAKGSGIGSRDLTESVKDTLMVREGESKVSEHVDCARAERLVIELLAQSAKNSALEGFRAVRRNRVVNDTHEASVAATGGVFKRIERKCDCGGPARPIELHSLQGTLFET